MPTKSQAAIFREATRAITQLREISMAVLKQDTKYTMADFTARYAKVDEHKLKLEEVYHAILDAKDLTSDVEAAYTKAYDTSVADYNQILVANAELQLKSAHLENTLPSTSTTPTAVLPKIALPKFSSKIEDWPSFIAIFRSLTDDMATISDAVKLHYLLSCLTGEARSMVSHLQLTNDNFTVAMDILTRRYENRRVLIDRFVDIIMGLPQIHARSDIRTLFLTPLISAQSALNNLDLPMKDCDYVFVSIVVRKLKGELRTLFERKYGNLQTLPTLNDLILFLEEHARCVETEWSSPASPQVSPQPRQYRRQSPVTPPRPPRLVSPHIKKHVPWPQLGLARSTSVRPQLNTDQFIQLNPQLVTSQRVTMHPARTAVTKGTSSSPAHGTTTSLPKAAGISFRLAIGVSAAWVPIMRTSASPRELAKSVEVINTTHHFIAPVLHLQLIQPLIIYLRISGHGPDSARPMSPNTIRPTPHT
ncbi:uncharacterized protein [Choristoneura fumiferana]|uniref:uncharacterized protein n=1 Tax=Choristoneura fumiferana TaxID=7141 RepID=UPI003D159FB4